MNATNDRILLDLLRDPFATNGEVAAIARGVRYKPPIRRATGIGVPTPTRPATPLYSPPREHGRARRRAA